METVPLPLPQVEVNHIDSSAVPVFTKSNEFCCRGKYLWVPKIFQFLQDVNRLNGWKVWHCVTVVCSLQGIDYAKKGVGREFTTKWKPTFKLMERYPGFDVLAQVDEAFVQASFPAATEYLKTLV